jgi:hypothetical protein
MMSAAAETEERREFLFIYTEEKKVSSRPARRTEGVITRESSSDFWNLFLEISLLFFIIIWPGAQLGPSRLSAFHSSSGNQLRTGGGPLLQYMETLGDWIVGQGLLTCGVVAGGSIIMHITTCSLIF